MAASTFQHISHFVVLVGVLLTAFGSWGAYIFGKKAEDEYRASLGSQISALSSPAEVLHMAAAERLGMVGGVVEPRPQGEGLRVRFTRLGQPFSSLGVYFRDIHELREITYDRVNMGQKSGSMNVDSLKSLVGLSKLESLSLIDAGIADLELLKGLTNLRVLILDQNKISDLKPLSGLKKLQLLGIRDNPVEDLSPLESCEFLYALWADGTMITDLSPLDDLKYLNTVELTGFFGEPSLVPPAEVERFMRIHPGVTLDYEESDLSSSNE